MNTNAVNVAVVDGKTITESVELRTTKQGDPVRIKAVKDGKYILAEGTDKPVAPENLTIKRVGNDLHVATEGTDPDQPQLIIEGFYESHGQLVGVAEDGAYYEYISSDAEDDHAAAFLADGVSSPQVLGSEELVGFGNGLVAGTGIGWLWPALLGLGALGLLGAAYQLTRDDDKKHNDVDPGANIPGTPSIGGASDNVGAVQGPIEKGDSTDDRTPTFTGGGTPGNTIIIEDNGTPIGEVIVGEDGKWEFTPDKPLPEGEHSIIVVEKDKDGNVSNPSDEFDFIIDITAPGKSAIDAITDDFGNQTGVISPNGLTDDNTPTLSGTAEAGSTLEVFANGEKIGETLVEPDGTWTFTPSPALADGEYSFTTVAIDAAGNAGLPSDPYIVTIDTTAPGKPGAGTGGIEEAIDNVGPIIGDIGNGGVTDDGTPTFGGGGLEPGDTVTIIDDGVEIGKVVVGEDGRWEFTPDPALIEGPHPITVIVTDPAGNESEPSDPYIVIVDTTAPGKPGAGTGGIEDAIDNVGPIIGDIGNGGTTDDGTPTFGGGGLEPGDTVTIIDDGVEIGKVVVGEDGRWEFTPDPALIDGPHPITVIVTDPAGNESEPSDPYIIIVDTTAPIAPTIDAVFDDQGTSTGNINPGDITDDAQPDISGTAEPGTTVIIYDNGVEIGRAPAGPDGRWTYTPVPPLANGPHDLSAKAEDAAGNTSDPSNSVDFELIAGGTPPAPSITGVLDDVADNVGNIMPGQSTNDTEPEVSGTAEPFSTVTLFANGVAVGSVVADALGNWSITPNPALAQGLNNLSATATNAAGNESAPTGDYPITVDTTAPVAADASELEDNVGAIVGPIASGDTTDDNTPTFSGTAEPNTTLIIFDNGVEIGRVPVDGAGNWSFTPAPALVDGLHSFSSIVVDAAGNRSPESTPVDFTVDTSAVAISIEQAQDNVGSIQDPLASGSVTDDATPTLNGQATPGSTVNIYLDGVLLQAGVPVNGLGRWEYTVAPALPEGSYAFTATVVTLGGGESAPTADFNLEIDLTPSAAPTIDEIRDDVGSIQDPLVDGATTDDTTPTLVGSGVAGDTVIIRNNGVEIGRELVGADGSWSFTPNPPLNNGSTNQFDVIAVDPAGNESAPSASWTIIIDTEVPIASAVVESMGKDSGADSGDFVTNDGSAGRLIQGSLTAALAAGEKVQISTDGGATWLDVLLNADGTWSFLDSSAYTGDWTIQTRVIDAAGNANTVSQAVTLDTTVNTPTSVSWDGTTIQVDFDGVGLEVGDKLHLLIDGVVVEYPLTQADIDAGTADLPWSSDSNGNADNISVALADQAGNISSYREFIKSDSMLFSESFNTQPASIFTLGQVIALDNFDLRVLAVGADFSYGRLGFSVGQPNWALPSTSMALLLNTGSQVQLELSGAAQEYTFISMDVGDFNNSEGITAIFYDQNGVEVYRESLVPGSAGLLTSITAELPYGSSFSSVSLQATGASDGAFWIDNIQLGRNEYTPGALPVAPEAAQGITQSGVEYFGGEGNNVFYIDNVGLLNNANSIVNGGGGIDSLALIGANQVLDLGAIAGKLESIEIIDITGTGNNTLNLSLGDVLEQGEASLFTADDAVQMMIKGNAGDVVNLDDLLADGTDPGDWAGMGQVTVEGVTYNVFQHSSLDAQLLVQDGVTTNLV